MTVMNSLLVLAILYGISGVYYLVNAVHTICKRNKLRLFDFVRIMYSMVYGFLPMLIYAIEADGSRNLHFYDYSDDGVIRLYIMYLLSIFAYGTMNLGYRVIKKQKGAIATIEANDPYKAKRLFRYGVICLVIGWGSMLIWTRAYGSIHEFILNASRIRSGKGTVYNPFAFMKQFVRILPISLYAVVSGYLYGRPKGLKRIGCLIVIAGSVVGNYLYLLESDSRASVFFTGIGIVAIIIRHRKKASIRSALFQSAIVMVVLLGITMAMDVFTSFIRHGIASSEPFDVTRSIIKEFRFIYASEMKAIKAWSEGKMQYQIGNDALNVFAAWIPERFVPYDIPATLWSYNTNLYGAVGSGTMPSALVSTGIYEIGILGAVLYPMLLGTVTALFDNRIINKTSNIYSDVYYGLCVGLFVQMVSHNQMSTFMAGLFPGFVFLILTFTLDRFKKR